MKSVNLQNIREGWSSRMNYEKREAELGAIEHLIDGSRIWPCT